MVKPLLNRRAKGRSRRNVNPRQLFTVAGGIMLAFSIFVIFEWGAPYAAVCAFAGCVLFIIGQGKPRQSGGRRWH